MRTDPRTACANARELWVWAAVHDLVAHPLMVLTWYSRAALRFHDWTSRRAWPRVADTQPAHPMPAHYGGAPLTRFGRVSVKELGPRLFMVRHGRVDHAVTLQADDMHEALSAGLEWFDSLAEQLGGKFETRFGDADCGRDRPAI